MYMLIWADSTPEVVWQSLYWIAIIGGSLIAVLLLIAILGCFYPRSYTAARALPSQRPPEEVWSVVNDLAATPDWHPEFKKVERLPNKNGHEIWHVTDNRGYPMQLETAEAVAPQRLVRKIADESGPFSGEWVFDIEPIGEGSKVTLTERGQIPNPFFRVMFWTFMTPTFYLEMYLQALAKKLGDQP
jgi:hypothetical protein